MKAKNKKMDIWEKFDNNKFWSDLSSIQKEGIKQFIKENFISKKELRENYNKIIKEGHEKHLSSAGCRFCIRTEMVKEAGYQAERLVAQNRARLM